jgi:hypothetical protein
MAELSELYQRNINVTVERAEQDHILVQCSLLDLDHSIRFLMKVNTRTKTIVESNAQMIRVPFHRCRDTLSLTESIAGLVIGRGINRQLADRLGHNNGCMHLVELAVTATRMAAAVLAEADRGITDRESFECMDEEERIAIGMPHLRNTCLVFKVEESR